VSALEWDKGRTGLVQRLAKQLMESAAPQGEKPMRSISIITPCRNEEENVEAIYEAVRAQMAKLGRYRYEHIFIDNASEDRTVELVKRLAAADKNVKLIVNTRNFGQVGSPMHALTQARGDAVIGIVADFQDPPELIPEMVALWEKGSPMVLCIKRSSAENPLMYALRKRYYRLINQLSSLETFENFTGSGLFDRKVIDQVIAFGDPQPYFRGIIAEIGYPHEKIFYDQPKRARGKTKNNFLTLFDMAMLGIINHSKAPLRLMTFAGFAGAVLSFLVGFAFLAYKLLFWGHFQVGVAPLVIGLFFGFSLQLAFMGLLGEYVGAIHTQLQNRPYAIERERLNFEFEPAAPLATEPSEAAVADLR
jgi:glycosyltransferase involved in cell wall biosynthesis